MMNVRRIRKNIGVLVLCSLLAFCNAKPPPEGINITLTSKKPAIDEPRLKEPQLQQTAAKAQEPARTAKTKQQSEVLKMVAKKEPNAYGTFMIDETEASKYLSVDAFKGDATTKKKAKAFISKLVDAEMVGLIFINNYLVSNISDEKRAPAAIAVILKMYNEKPHLVSSIESMLVNNVTSDNAAKFEAGAALLYHLMKEFPNKGRMAINPYEVDQAFVLQKMIHHLKVTKEEKVKIIGAEYLVLLSNLLNVPLK